VPTSPSASIGVDKPTEASKSGLPAATYVLGGIGMAALGVFAYVGARAKHDSSSLHATCAPGCPHDEVTALETKLVVADVALGVGVVSAAAAVFFALRGSRSSAVTWDLRVAPASGGAHAELDVPF
jgi:hypothetical protein